MTAVGELSLWVALFLAAWGSVASFGGATVRRPELVASGRRAIVAGAAMTTLACLGLWAALLGHDFSLDYVASHTTLNMPALYLLTALWAGPPGKMLSFALTLSLCAAAVVSSRRWAADARLPWVAGALASVIAFVLVAVCFVTNPYDRVAWVPGEGQGLDPRLQHALAAPYYLATYAACGASAVPFALAIAATSTRRADTPWLASLHRWSVATWLLFTASIALRMRWTYVDPLARGVWDAGIIDVATLAGWVLGFALLRAFARGGPPPPRRVAALALAVFCLAFATAAVVPGPPAPSGGAAATPVRALVGLVGFGFLAALLTRWAVTRLPGGTAGTAESPRRGRVAEAITYVGVALLLAGLASARWSTGGGITVRPGEAAELSDPYGRRWRFVSQGVSRDEGMNYLSTGVALEAVRGGRGAGIISAERRQYLDSANRMTFEPALRPGVRSSAGLDVYVVLGGVRGEVAQLRVEFRPLIALVWLGWLAVAGGGVALAARWSPGRTAWAGVHSTTPV